ncbi:MAG: biotin-dependent carboxyltransferase family protein [Sporolactobacillus sp.]
MTVTIAEKGFHATVQDLGRHGYQRFGIIVGGAMDSPSAQLANWLVGNAGGAAVIEYSFLGPTVCFDQPTVFAVTGAQSQPQLDEYAIRGGRPVLARKGQVLKIGGLIRGSRGYLAVSGGFDTPLWLGSRSTYERAGCGGYRGRALRATDRLPVGSLSAMQKRLLNRLLHHEADGFRWYAGLRRSYRQPVVIRVMRDAQWALFTEASHRAFFSSDYRIGPASDRMGYRLEGEVIRRTEARDMFSEAVTFGSVQVPPGGQPIVLMADHQSTGGYPRIAQIAAVDLPVLAQLTPGQSIHFQAITCGEAEHLLLRREQTLAALQGSIHRRLQQTLNELDD